VNHENPYIMIASLTNKHIEKYPLESFLTCLKVIFKLSYSKLQTIKIDAGNPYNIPLEALFANSSQERREETKKNGKNVRDEVILAQKKIKQLQPYATICLSLLNTIEWEFNNFLDKKRDGLGGKMWGLDASQVDHLLPKLQACMAMFFNFFIRGKENTQTIILTKDAGRELTKTVVCFLAELIKGTVSKKEIGNILLSDKFTNNVSGKHGVFEYKPAKKQGKSKTTDFGLRRPWLRTIGTVILTAATVVSAVISTVAPLIYVVATLASLTLVATIIGWIKYRNEKSIRDDIVKEIVDKPTTVPDRPVAQSYAATGKKLKAKPSPSTKIDSTTAYKSPAANQQSSINSPQGSLVEDEDASRAKAQHTR